MNRRRSRHKRKTPAVPGFFRKQAYARFFFVAFFFAVFLAAFFFFAIRVGEIIPLILSTHAHANSF
jgi:hypothetical protein